MDILAAASPPDFWTSPWGLLVLGVAAVAIWEILKSVRENAMARWKEWRLPQSVSKKEEQLARLRAQMQQVQGYYDDPHRFYHYTAARLFDFLKAFTSFITLSLAIPTGVNTIGYVGPSQQAVGFVLSDISVIVGLVFATRCLNVATRTTNTIMHVRGFAEYKVRTEDQIRRLEQELQAIRPISPSGTGSS